VLLKDMKVSDSGADSRNNLKEPISTNLQETAKRNMQAIIIIVKNLRRSSEVMRRGPLRFWPGEYADVGCSLLGRFGEGCEGCIIVVVG